MTDPSQDSATRLKRLRFRSWHRGTREMDLLLGRFADGNLPRFSACQLARFEELLEQNDVDIYNWVTRREPIPRAADSDVLRLLRSEEHTSELQSLMRNSY